MSKLSESVGKYIKGDKKAFDDIYTLTYRSVYITVKLYLKREKEIEDAMQDIYIKAAYGLHTLKDVSLAKTWLCAVSKNVCFNILRKKTEVLLDEEKEFIMNNQRTRDEESIPETALDKKEKYQIIMELVGQLPIEQREAVIHYYINELPVKRVAEICDCSTGTVKSRLSYAREKLKEMVLEQERKTGTKLRGFLPLPIGFVLRCARERLPLSSLAAKNTIGEVYSMLAVPFAQGADEVGISVAAISIKSSVEIMMSTAGTKAVIVMTAVAFGIVATPVGIAVTKNNDVIRRQAVVTQDLITTGETEPSQGGEIQEIRLIGELKEEYISDVIQPLAQFVVNNPGKYSAERFLTAEYVNNFLISTGVVERRLHQNVFSSVQPDRQSVHENVLIPKVQILNMLSDMFGMEYIAALENSQYDSETQREYDRKGIFENGYYPFFYSDGDLFADVKHKDNVLLAESGEKITFTYDALYAGGEDLGQKMYVVLEHDPESKYSCIITEFGTE